jgi:hypothetical protein
VVRGDWKDVDIRSDVGHWRPLLERPVADGMLTDVGIHETVVHQAEDVSPGLWWSSTSPARIEKARLAAIRIPPAPGLAPAKHGAFFLWSLIWKSRPGSGSHLPRASDVLLDQSSPTSLSAGRRRGVSYGTPRQRHRPLLPST